jgi:hypothetical protein
MHSRSRRSTRTPAMDLRTYSASSTTAASVSLMLAAFDFYECHQYQAQNVLETRRSLLCLRATDNCFYEATEPRYVAADLQRAA